MNTPAANNASTNNFVVLKIQLNHEAKSEYFRKRVDVNSLTFTQLHELLQSLVVTPDNSRLVITYVDSDLDEIRVNDDADLREALLVKDETRSGALRLSVKVGPRPHTSPTFARNPGSASNLRQYSSVGPSNSSTCCPNWRQILRQHKRSGCQRRPVTRGDGTVVPFFIEHSVLPLPPSHIWNMFAVESLEHDNTTFIGELFAQPLLAALLQTTVDAQAPASTATETERSGSGSNVILEAFRDFEDISHRLRGFDSLFASPFCASRRVCESKAGLERSPEPKPAEHTPSDPKEDVELQSAIEKEDVELQAAIESSLSTTNAPESATPGPAPKAEHENDYDEVTAVQSTAPSTASNAKGGSTAQTAPVALPLEGSSAEAKADAYERLHSEAAKGPYESEIEQLKSMGFYDIEAISAALRATDGNVEYALWRLL